MKKQCSWHNKVFFTPDDETIMFKTGANEKYYASKKCYKLSKICFYLIVMICFVYFASLFLSLMPPGETIPVLLFGNFVLPFWRAFWINGTLSVVAIVATTFITKQTQKCPKYVIEINKQEH